MSISPPEYFQVRARCSYYAVVWIPYSFIVERYLGLRKRTPFVKQATPFEDIVIRYVRYAFANLPAHIGRVFFSKQVALPFFKWRLLRHGFAQPPKVSYTEVNLADMVCLNVQ